MMPRIRPWFVTLVAGLALMSVALPGMFRANRVQASTISSITASEGRTGNFVVAAQNTTTGTETPTGMLTPTNTSVGQPAPTNTPRGQPAPTNTPQGQPAPTNTPQGQPAPTNTPTGQPAPTNTPQGQPGPTITNTPTNTTVTQTTPTNTTVTGTTPTTGNFQPPQQPGPTTGVPQVAVPAAPSPVTAPATPGRPAAVIEGEAGQIAEGAEEAPQPLLPGTGQPVPYSLLFFVAGLLLIAVSVGLRRAAQRRKS